MMEDPSWMRKLIVVASVGAFIGAIWGVLTTSGRVQVWVIITIVWIALYLSRAWETFKLQDEIKRGRSI